MERRTHRTWPAVLLVGGAGLTLAACGSGGSDTSTGTSDNGSPSGSSGGIVSAVSVDGTKTFADASGHTLYSAASEAGGHILCVGSCTNFWKPLKASQQQAKQASTALGEQFGVVNRPDGGTQLTYEGKPLYTFTQEGADQLTGNGFSDEFGGTKFQWSAAGTEGGAPSSSGSGNGNGGYGY